MSTNEESSKAMDLVTHTRELYAAILRARSETSGLVLKDMGDAIFDAIPWEELGTPVKVALVTIARELMHSNTERVIRDISDEAQTSIVYQDTEVSNQRPNKEKTERGGAYVRFGSDEIENQDDTTDQASLPDRQIYTGGKVEILTPEEKATLNQDFGRFGQAEKETEPTEENTAPPPR